MGAESTVSSFAASPLGSYGHLYLCYCIVVKLVGLAASLAYGLSFLQ